VTRSWVDTCIFKKDIKKFIYFFKNSKKK